MATSKDKAGLKGISRQMALIQLRWQQLRQMELDRNTGVDRSEVTFSFPLQEVHQRTSA